MSGLYEKVSHPAEHPKRRKNSKWMFLLLAVAVAVITAWVLSVYGTLSLRPKFYSFVSALSDSTVYAYDHDSLRSEADGETARVTGDNAYAFYNALAVSSPSRVLRIPPQGPADLTLDYGDGSQLRLWQMDEAQGYGFHLSYKTTAGDHFLFTFKSGNLYPLKQYVSLFNNGPWME